MELVVMQVSPSSDSCISFVLCLKVFISK